MVVIAVLLPWLALLVGGHYGPAAACLLLQLTIVGWIPASIWAVAIMRQDERDRQYQQLVDRLRH